MSANRDSVAVSLPSGLVSELDALVEAGVFGSRSEALRYGARLVVREERLYGGGGSEQGDDGQARPLEGRVPDSPDEGSSPL